VEKNRFLGGGDIGGSNDVENRGLVLGGRRKGRWLSRTHRKKLKKKGGDVASDGRPPRTGGQTSFVRLQKTRKQTRRK